MFPRIFATFGICLVLAGCGEKGAGRPPDSAFWEESAALAEVSGAPEKPVLYALLAASDTFRNAAVTRNFAAGRSVNKSETQSAAAFADFLLRQRGGNLYSRVIIRTLIGEDFTKEKLSTALDGLAAIIQPDDTALVYLSAYSGADKAGNLFIIPWDGKDSNGKRRIAKQNIAAADIAAKLRALATRKIVTLINTNRPGTQYNSASGAPADLPLVIAEKDTAPALMESFANAGDSRYVTATRVSDGNFALFDTWLEKGELAIGTLFAGTVTVTRNAHGGEEVGSGALDSLGAASFKLDEGTYNVSIVYRNSFSESRTVEVVNNSKSDISFTYRPILSARSFSGTLPAFGVNIAELNPRNYQKIDQNALSAMGMEQYRVSFLAGENHYRSGDYAKAIAEFNRCVNLKADFAEVYIARGNAYRKQGDAARAIADYSLALRYGGARAEVYNYRGYAGSENGESGKAIADFTQALKLKPDYADALINRAHVYYETGDYQKAIDDYTRVITLEPRNAVVWNRRGSAFYRNGDSAQALADFSRAIELSPSYALAWQNRGNVWYNSGDYEKALADLNQAVKLEPSASARNARENVLKMLGETGEAKAN